MTQHFYTHPFVPLEGDPAWLCASSAQSMHRFVFEQRRVAEMLVDWIGGHFGYVLRCLGLDVKSDEGVRHQVVDRLKPLLTNKMLPVIKQPVVEGLGSKSGEEITDRVERNWRGNS